MNMVGNRYVSTGVNGQVQYVIQKRSGMGVPQTMYQPVGMDRRVMSSGQQGMQSVQYGQYGQYGQQTFINAMDNTTQYIPTCTKSAYV